MKLERVLVTHGLGKTALNEFCKRYQWIPDLNALLPSMFLFFVKYNKSSLQVYKHSIRCIRSKRLVWGDQSCHPGVSRRGLIESLLCQFKNSRVNRTNKLGPWIFIPCLNAHKITWISLSAHKISAQPGWASYVNHQSIKWTRISSCPLMHDEFLNSNRWFICSAGRLSDCK